MEKDRVESLRGYLEKVWKRTDLILSIIPDQHMLERPISLRHPFLFYLGHLPAFASNQLRAVLGLRSSSAKSATKNTNHHHPQQQQQQHDAKFEEMFARGIDPDVMDPSQCHPHSTVPTEMRDWPSVEEVRQFRDRVRHEIRTTLFDRVVEQMRKMLQSGAGGGGDAGCCPFPQLVAGMRVIWMIIEHEVMHQETLLYMIVQLDHSKKLRPPELISASSFVFDAVSSPSSETEQHQMVHIPEGVVCLGVDFQDNPRPFGWDNEFPLVRDIKVAAFDVDKHPVTNGMFLKFVRDGGYENERFWRPCDWAWRVHENLQHPACWRRRRDSSLSKITGEDEFFFRTLFEDIPLELVTKWPVFVSGAEAHAYCQWKGRRLMTESEFQRAAFGDNAASNQLNQINIENGNFDFGTWAPLPVGNHGKLTHISPFGVHDLISNGWEHTCTEFKGFDGFQVVFPSYPGYSADFFDQKHFVVKGASFATDACLVRPSFRNWFQFNYPFVFAKFRTAC